MSERYTLVATPAFKITLRKLLRFLDQRYGAQAAQVARHSIRQRVEQLADLPTSAPISERLAVLGFNSYRQLRIDEHNLVIYRIDESAQKIILVVAMDTRQSIEQLLYEVTIEI